MVWFAHGLNLEHHFATRISCIGANNNSIYLGNFTRNLRKKKLYYANNYVNQTRKKRENAIVTLLCASAISRKKVFSEACLKKKDLKGIKKFNQKKCTRKISELKL